MSTATRTSGGKFALIRLVYNLLFPFVLLALLPGFAGRMVKRGKYRHKFGQRFGIYSARVKARLAVGGWTWVHAVSVGEVLIALKLIRTLKTRQPDLKVVLSTTTSTGFTLANKEKSDWLEPIYNPLDFLWTARRAIGLIRPRQFILVEAEVWPNLTALARARGATLALVNARLSPRSESRYRMVRPLAAALFNQLDRVCVQEPSEIARWQSLGIHPEKILCPGSIKFDDAAESGPPKRDFRPALRALGVPDDAPILLAGSTHSGEERILGEIVLRLRRDFPNLFFLVIPRHAERWREILADLTQLGFRTAVRSGEAPVPDQPDCLLANTTGELKDWFDCATVVFIGKSLTARGGQNPAEAVAAGKATIFGPHMENFASLTSQLLRDGGALQAADAAELERHIHSLLADPDRCHTLASRGSACLAVHRGATVRTCEILEDLTSS